MLGYFPPPYKGEAFYSVCARNKDRVEPRNQSSYRILHTLFGANAPVHIQWPSHLEYFASQLPNEFAINADRLILENTLAPMMRPFLSVESYIELQLYMRGSDLTQKLGMIRHAVENQTVLKYCVLCAREDRDSLGEAYWHRLHQTSIVQVCPIHNCYLSHVSRPEVFDVVPAEEVIPLAEPIEMANTKDPHDALLLWMARQVEWLLDHPYDAISTANLDAAYTQAFYACGLLSLRGKPDLVRIRDQFNRAMRDHFTRSRQFTVLYHAASERSLNRAIRLLEGHPGLHLLLMYFLSCNVECLSTKSQFFHFEPGPWPCLNATCELHGKAVIPEYRFVPTSMVRRSQHSVVNAGTPTLVKRRTSRVAPDLGHIAL